MPDVKCTRCNGPKDAPQHQQRPLAAGDHPYTPGMQVREGPSKGLLQAMVDRERDGLQPTPPLDTCEHDAGSGSLCEYNRTAIHGPRCPNRPLSDEALDRALTAWYRSARVEWMPRERDRMRRALEAAR